MANTCSRAKFATAQTTLRLPAAVCSRFYFAGASWIRIRGAST
jgi:hypothetical protein